MKTLNFVLAGFWAITSFIHFVFQHPATWWMAGLMATSLALYTLQEALDD